MAPLTPFAFAMHALLILLSFILITTILPSDEASSDHRSFHIKLIHRDSPLSPFYNPDDTLFDRNIRAFKSSLLRYANLITSTGRSDEFQGQVEFDGSEYLAKFSIGTPPVEILAVLDTGSDLIWIQCLPCESCYKQPSSIYDPSKSSTYTNLTCDSPYCILLPNWNCHTSSNLCSYTYTYSDWSYSKGTLSSEVLTFETSDDGLFSVDNIIFGCGHNNDNTSPSRDAGILGMAGGRNLSFISQLHSTIDGKFSYCFGNRSDPSAASHLLLGNNIFWSNNTTPLKIIEGKYYLKIEGISVGKKRLAISSRTSFKYGGGGAVIDTGTMLTFLAEEAYYRLVEELEEQLKVEVHTIPDLTYERCYTGKLSDLDQYQEVTFHFAGGLDVFLDRWNLFIQVERGDFCLAVLPSSSGEPTVLGNLFQQFYSVGYDLARNVVSFTQMDCSLLKSG